MNDNINLILTRDPDLLLMKEIEKEIHELPESEQTGLKHWVRIVDHIRQPDSVVLSCLRSPEEIEIERRNRCYLHKRNCFVEVGQV